MDLSVTRAVSVYLSPLSLGNQTELTTHLGLKVYWLYLLNSMKLSHYLISHCCIISLGMKPMAIFYMIITSNDIKLTTLQDSSFPLIVLYFVFRIRF